MATSTFLTSSQPDAEPVEATAARGPFTDFSQHPDGVEFHRGDGSSQVFPRGNEAVYDKMIELNVRNGRHPATYEGRNAKLASNDPVYDPNHEASLDPRYVGGSTPRADENVSRADVSPALIADPVDSLPPVQDAPTRPAAPSPQASPAPTEVRPPDAGGPRGGIVFSGAGQGAPGAAATAPDRVWLDTNDAIRDAYVKDQLRSSRGQLVKGGAFETGRVRTEGDAVDPNAVAAKDINDRRSRDEQFGTLQEGADLNAQKVEKQYARSDALDEDHGIRQLERDADMADLHRQSVALARNIGESQVDTDHFWKSKTSSQKMTTAFGLLLSGLGSGMSHQKNLAAEAIDNSITADIQEQKDRIGRKGQQLSAMGDLYSKLRQAGMDDAQATAVAKDSAMQRVGVQMEAIANASGNPLAIAKAREWVAGTNKATTDLNFQLAEDQAKRSQTQRHIAVTQDRVVGGGRNLKEALRASTEGAELHGKLAEQAAKAAGGGPQTVHVGGTPFVLPGVEKEEGHAVRKQVAATNGALASIDQLDRIYSDSATGGVVSTAEADAAKSQVLSQLSVLNGQGAMSDDEYKRNAAVISGFRGGAGLRALKTNVKAQQEAILSTYGAVPAK